MSVSLPMARGIAAIFARKSLGCAMTSFDTFEFTQEKGHSPAGFVLMLATRKATSKFIVKQSIGLVLKNLTK